MRISDWSSDVCSSDLAEDPVVHAGMSGLRGLLDVARRAGEPHGVAGGVEAHPAAQRGEDQRAAVSGAVDLERLTAVEAHGSSVPHVGQPAEGSQATEGVEPVVADAFLVDGDPAQLLLLPDPTGYVGDTLLGGSHR